MFSTSKLADFNDRKNSKDIFDLRVARWSNLCHPRCFLDKPHIALIIVVKKQKTQARFVVFTCPLHRHRIKVIVRRIVVKGCYDLLQITKFASG